MPRSREYEDGEYLLSVDEVAERCGVSRRTVFAWIAAGYLTVVRFGRRVVRIREADLDSMIERQRVAGGRKS